MINFNRHERVLVLKQLETQLRYEQRDLATNVSGGTRLGQKTALRRLLDLERHYGQLIEEKPDLVCEQLQLMERSLDAAQRRSPQLLREIEAARAAILNAFKQVTVAKDLSDMLAAASPKLGVDVHGLIAGLLEKTSAQGVDELREAVSSASSHELRRAWSNRFNLLSPAYRAHFMALLGGTPELCVTELAQGVILPARIRVGGGFKVDFALLENSSMQDEITPRHLSSISLSLIDRTSEHINVQYGFDPVLKGWYAYEVDNGARCVSLQSICMPHSGLPTFVGDNLSHVALGRAATKYGGLALVTGRATPEGHVVVGQPPVGFKSFQEIEGMANEVFRAYVGPEGRCIDVSFGREPVHLSGQRITRTAR